MAVNVQNFASVKGMTGESIQGTYKAQKNSASTHVFSNIKSVRVRLRVRASAKTQINVKFN